MSWDKQTSIFSEIDTIVTLLDDLRYPYTIEVMGLVQGHGFNDSFNFPYPIRKLSYADKVVLERMHRHPDCDISDVIQSFKFNAEEAPTEWEIAVDLVVDGYEYVEDDDDSCLGCGKSVDDRVEYYCNKCLENLRQIKDGGCQK